MLTNIDTLLAPGEVKLFEATGTYSGYTIGESKGCVLAITTKRIIVLLPWGKDGYGVAAFSIQALAGYECCISKGTTFSYLFFVVTVGNRVARFALDKGQDGVRFQQILAELLARRDAK
jgi:hypothetical protein